MDDMTAFERQLDAELGRMAGPGRRIDGMAMVRTVSTQSPRWRVQPIFSALKFVVAGAIVALFGGFLLSAVLTQQPSEEQVPAAVTGSPVPTTTPDLLPGVDLITEEVEPGVYRVLSDGVREFGHSTRSRNLSPTFREDGSLWTASSVELSRLGSDETVKLPAPGASGRGDWPLVPLGCPGPPGRAGAGTCQRPRSVPSTARRGHCGARAWTRPRPTHDGRRTSSSIWPSAMTVSRGPSVRTAATRPKAATMLTLAAAPGTGRMERLSHR